MVLFDTKLYPFTLEQEKYTPQATLTQTAQQNQLTNPNTIGNINIGQYYNPQALQNTMYQGIKTAVNEQFNDALKRQNEMLAKTGLFRSGVNLANYNKLQGEAMDALAKGYGETAYKVAQLQDEHAKAQALLDFDVSKYSADIQNAWREKNYEYLMNAAAQDQNTINEAAKYNIQIKSAYDEMLYNWAKALLGKELDQYKTNLGYLAQQATNIAQYGSQTAKDKWNALGLDTYLATQVKTPTPTFRSLF